MLLVLHFLWLIEHVIKRLDPVKVIQFISQMESVFHSKVTQDHQMIHNRTIHTARAGCAGRTLDTPEVRDCNELWQWVRHCNPNKKQIFVTEFENEERYKNVFWRWHCNLETATEVTDRNIAYIYLQQVVASKRTLMWRNLPPRCVCLIPISSLCEPCIRCSVNGFTYDAVLLLEQAIMADLPGSSTVVLRALKYVSLTTWHRYCAVRFLFLIQQQG